MEHARTGSLFFRFHNSSFPFCFSLRLSFVKLRNVMTPLYSVYSISLSLCCKSWWIPSLLPLLFGDLVGVPAPVSFSGLLVACTISMVLFL